MKRFSAAILSLCLIFTMCAPQAAAADDTALRTVRALGIMTGDQNGEMNLTSPVTRSEFSKMAICASSLKNSIGQSSGFSPFKDVKYYHWAAEYIAAMASSGWMIGYVDGTFHPNGTITLEEAATVMLRMLGYTSSDLVGAYPAAQLAKYQSLGLGQGVSRVKGDTLMRDDCVQLFYNLMTAKTKTGQYYAATLGYAVTMSGEIDYPALVSSGQKGPYIAQSSDISTILPFPSVRAEVYRDGNLSSLASVETHDVIYYHANLNTVWAFSAKVVGLYTAALPGAAAPSSAIVGGNTYALGTQAAYKLSSLGSYSPGDTVTLLLGKSGEAVDVLDGSVGNGVYYGVITALNTASYTTAAGVNETRKTVSVACTDGMERQFIYSGGAAKGEVVSVAVSGGVPTVKALMPSRVSGKVDAAGQYLGDRRFAKDVEIIDVSESGQFSKVFPSRLAGAIFNTGDIACLIQNVDGEITHMVLSNATGDFNVYGIITSVSETEIPVAGGGTQMSAAYRYVINGTPGIYTSNTTFLRISTGPSVIEMLGTTLDGATPLKQMKITFVGSDYVLSDTSSYKLASQVQVYIRAGAEYALTSLSSVQNLDDYTLYGYYDSGSAAGGYVRIIVADEK